jgi:hypothetical protein
MVFKTRLVHTKLDTYAFIAIFLFYIFVLCLTIVLLLFWRAASYLDTVCVRLYFNSYEMI